MPRSELEVIAIMFSRLMQEGPPILRKPLHEVVGRDGQKGIFVATLCFVSRDRLARGHNLKAGKRGVQQGIAAFAWMRRPLEIDREVVIYLKFFGHCSLSSNG